MISKVWKVFKEVAIGILLVLSLWLVVNGALKESKGHFEFGNLMDFFNTLGTLGTLVIAFLAFKKAPDWFKTKNNEIAHTKATEFFSEFMIDYSKKIETLYPLIEPFRELPKNLTLHDYYNEILSTHCLTNQLELRTVLKGKAISLYEYIIYFNTYGWVLKEDINLKVNSLYNLHTKVEDLMMEYAKKYSEISNSKPYGGVEENKFIDGVDFLDRQYMLIEKEITKCRDIILEIFRAGNSPESYFIIPRN
jgi:hypothetical protein